MAEIRIKGDKSKYSAKDKDCLGRSCLNLGHFQVRGATMSGSRNTGQISPCCMTRAYHGCPPYGDDEGNLYQIDKKLLSKRKSEGMKMNS